MAKSNLVGSWAFLIGVLLAVIFGAMDNMNENLVYALVVIGLIAGLLNIADKESGPFLMSGAVLIIASSLGGASLGNIPYLSGILSALLLIFVPATIVVSIRNVFSIARH